MNHHGMTTVHIIAQDFDYRTMLRPEVQRDLEKFEKKRARSRIKPAKSNVPRIVKSSSHF